MDRSSLCSELDDGVAGLSLSLVSYGSDLDASVGDCTPNLKSKTIKSLSDNESVDVDEASTPTNANLNATRQRAQQFSITGLSETKKKEVEAALAELVAAQAEYLEMEEIRCALQSVISSDILPQPTRDNVKKIWCRQGVLSYVGAGPKPGLLGLHEEQVWTDCQRSLSETDQKIVRLAAESQLIENARALKQSESSKQEIVNQLSGSALNSAGRKAESDHTSRMSSLQTELNNELDKFYKLLVSLDSLLETIVQMRTNKMTETCSKIIEGYEAKAQLLKQNARLINLQIQSVIYTEDVNIVPAMQRLDKDLDLLYSEMEMELSKSKGLLASYDRVKCPEYDKILDEYRHVMKEIKSVQYLLKSKELMPMF